MLSSPNPLCFSYWSLSESHPQNSPSGLCSLLAALWKYKWLWSQASSVHKLCGSFDIFLHNKPLIRSFIWEWASPFSRFWTTVFAILVRWPMFPFRLPPSALEIKVEKLQSANSRNKQTDRQQTYWRHDGYQDELHGTITHAYKSMTTKRWEALTEFCHFPPKHPESCAPAGNAGRAEESKQPDIENNEQKGNTKDCRKLAVKKREITKNMQQTKMTHL